jgi:hypothetical protein
MASTAVSKAVKISIALNSGFGVLNIAQGEKSADHILGDVINTGGQIAMDSLDFAKIGSSIGKGIQAAKSVGTTISAAAAEGSPLAAAGPPGWVVEAVLFIVQMTGILIDTFLNPFKTYFNSDLKDIKKSIDEHIRKLFISKGYDYPLEIKPLIEQNDEKTKKYIQQYFEDNGLISNEDVISEEDLVIYQKMVSRIREIKINPLYTNINTASRTSQNIALLIAAAAVKEKGYQTLKDIPIIDVKNYKKNIFLPIINWSSANWQIILILICSILTSSSISILLFN